MLVAVNNKSDVTVGQPAKKYRKTNSKSSRGVKNAPFLPYIFMRINCVFKVGPF